jgi:hypothetical protein
MASYDWFKMTRTSKNLTWKFNFSTCVQKIDLHVQYGRQVERTLETNSFPEFLHYNRDVHSARTPH